MFLQSCGSSSCPCCCRPLGPFVPASPDVARRILAQREAGGIPLGPGPVIANQDFDDGFIPDMPPPRGPPLAERLGPLPPEGRGPIEPRGPPEPMGPPEARGPPPGERNLAARLGPVRDMSPEEMGRRREDEGRGRGRGGFRGRGRGGGFMRGGFMPMMPPPPGMRQDPRGVRE
jgi:hypothetical protein